MMTWITRSHSGRNLPVFGFVVSHRAISAHSQPADHFLVVELTVSKFFPEFFGSHREFEFLLVDVINHTEHKFIAHCIFADSNIEIKGFLMKDLLLLLIGLSVELEVRLRPQPRIVGILAYDFEVAFVFHPFLEDEIIFDGGLLLAYSPLVD
jgi:hypothetical protein